MQAAQLQKGDTLRIIFRNAEKPTQRTYRVHGVKTYPGGSMSDIFRSTTVVETTVGTLLTFPMMEAVDAG